MNILKTKIKYFLKEHIGYLNKNLPNIKKFNKLERTGHSKKYKNKKILIATSSGGLYPHLIFESILGMALDYKGAEVEYLLCNKSLSACIMSTSSNISENELIKNGPKKLCTNCYLDGFNYLKKTGIKINKISDFLSNKDFLKAKKISRLTCHKKIKNFLFDKISIGEHAYAGTLRYFASINLNIEKNGFSILKKYFESALISKLAMDNFFLKNHYDLILMNHGIYVPQGIINEYAKHKKFKIVTWFPFYRKKTYGFFRGDTYQKEFLTEKNYLWENIKLTKQKNMKLLNYLESRKTGKYDWKFFYNKPVFEKKSFFNKYNIDKSKPLIGMATNVIWDAQIDYPKQVFKNLLDWIIYTIKFFQKNQQLQLVIRVHPAEVNSDRAPKQKVADEINKKFKKLTKNIIIVPPDDPISSYTIFEKCNSVIIYASKLGIELSAVGTPVIVAGAGQIKNKKIAFDVNSMEDYDFILNEFPLKKSKYLNKKKILRAKKYAYHAFFRKPTMIKSVGLNEDRWPNIGIDKKFYSYLKNNNDKGLNFVCDAILNDKTFIYDE